MIDNPTRTRFQRPHTTPTTITDLVQVNAQLPPPLYEALRLRAYQQHTSMAEIVRLALAAYLATGKE